MPRVITAVPHVHAAESDTRLTRATSLWRFRRWMIRRSALVEPHPFVSSRGRSASMPRGAVGPRARSSAPPRTYTAACPQLGTRTAVLLPDTNTP
jgi:hypothetical protein